MIQPQKGGYPAPVFAESTAVIKRKRYFIVIFILKIYKFSIYCQSQNRALTFNIIIPYYLKYN